MVNLASNHTLYLHRIRYRFYFLMEDEGSIENALLSAGKVLPDLRVHQSTF